MILVYTVLILLTVLLLFQLFTTKRLRVAMAALVAWIVGSIAGAGSKEEDQDQPQPSPSCIKSKKTTRRQRVKSPQNEVPTFSTPLTTPIEEVIEETLVEEGTSTSFEEGTSQPIPIALTKPRKRNKPTKSSTKTNSSDEVGFSFFKTKSLESFPPINKQSTESSQESVVKRSKSDLEQSTTTATTTSSSSDQLGFSFLPVKDRRNSRKNKQVKISDLPESSINQYYKAPAIKKAPVKEPEIHDSYVVIDRVDKPVKIDGKNPQDIIEVINKSTGKCVYLEVKESKRVDSKVSYASVASGVDDKLPALIHTEPEVEEPKTKKPVELEQTEEIRVEAPTVQLPEDPVVLSTTSTVNGFPQPSNNLKSTEDFLEQEKEHSLIVHDKLIEETNLQPSTLQQEEEHEKPIENPVEKTNLEPSTEDFLQEEKQHSSIDHENLIAPKIEETNLEPLIRDKIEETEHLIDYNNTTEQSPEQIVEMSTGPQIRVLTLNDKEHQDTTLYRIEKNWIVQFRLGPSLFGRKVTLYCNYPSGIATATRNTYTLLKWTQDEGCKNSDDTAYLAEITAKISGSFHYYFTYDDQDEHQGSGFFLVDPVLRYGHNEELPLDCIQCQTVLAKSLGPFDTWESKLRVAKESGYNMIHFTPIQQLGDSNSSYSLSEQLKVNPLFTTHDGKCVATFGDIETLVSKMRSEWKMCSICDIVLNHTANESAWLVEHPEVTYNCSNCPYMRPAYLLDAALLQFSRDIVKGLYEDKGIPAEVNCEDHLNAIRHYLHTDVLPKIKIDEMFTCDVAKYVTEFLTLTRGKPVSDGGSETIDLIQDPLYRRLASTIDITLALKLYNVYRNDCFDEETRIKRCAEEFKSCLDFLNGRVQDQINAHLTQAVDNCIAGIRYFRVQSDGPRIKEVSLKNPLFIRYFTDLGEPKSVEEHESIMYDDDKSRFLMAHNGWVMNSDPLANFAALGSNVYIRRELIAWGDSVKLRYGEKPEDCPFLWNHMRTYVEQTAKIFDGIRLDNCHSTPIPVAEYLLECARKVRPDLYVVAELFTNSDMTDNIFVNRLGITSLIREAMSAWDSHEQGRLVYRYGGSPVGSFYQPRMRPLVPSVAHALFLDLTHDNPSPVSKRSVFDLLPSTALVNMACCASGSNRGYDELVPHHIHVVDEERQYAEWNDEDQLTQDNVRFVNSRSGIIAAKKALNDLHHLLGRAGFNQVYVDQMDPDVVAVTRHCPDTHQSYILVAFTAFTHPSQDAATGQRNIRPLRVEGVLDEIVLEATLDHVTSSKYTKFENFAEDPKWINGLSEYRVDVRQNLQPKDSSFFEKVDSGSPDTCQLNFVNFKPGSVAVIKVSLKPEMKKAVDSIRNMIRAQFSSDKKSELWRIVSQINLGGLSRALYRCDQEEKDDGFGFDTYDIPSFGHLVYAGLQGFITLLSTIRPNNDLGHPMCGNLRGGNWMIDYIWQRLKNDPPTLPLGLWIEQNVKPLKLVPRYLIPCYFDVLVTGLYALLLEQSHALMADFVTHGSTFVKGLAMGSLQFASYVKSGDLPVLSPDLDPPRPEMRVNEKGEKVQACVSLSAGLPHFSVGYMRNWGRDTFIAMRGLFLLTGRFQEARYHILGYGACLRHGLIPNLLDGGRNPRFNCRDALWWWLHCIKSYAETAPNGPAILKDKVPRIFPTDDSPNRAPGECDQPLHDVIQEALNVHFQGLVFRERNAGRQIDEHMADNGFDNQIGVHPETGFVFGGNDANCGTWMDKMGSSDKAGNRGKPATPRDGSAIELIGLSRATIDWLDRMHKANHYPYDSVERKSTTTGTRTKWTFRQWADKIRQNFETHFWVHENPTEGEVRPDLINKRGIYKDCSGASREWTDFQLRCNFPIAMVVAPDLFDPKHAWIALNNAQKHLLGPLGMKTLDPEDWAYNGNYDNSDSSDHFNTANGYNYHQGPEWVWPVGFFLRAKLHFAKLNGKLPATISEVKHILSHHFVELQTSAWRGLPELTNKDGAYCHGSCKTQAWSMSCILEALYDLQRAEKENPLVN